MSRVPCPSSKVCFKCGVEKSLGEFYAHPMMGDGHLGKCKECTKRDSKENDSRRDRVVEYPYGAYPELKKVCRECGEEKPIDEFYYRPSGKYQRRADCCRCLNARMARRENKHTNPDYHYPDRQRRASGAVNNAVRDGRIVKPESCERCGAKGRISGHHPDYSKPLDVVWLCTKCHGYEHRKRRVKTAEVRVA